MGVWLINANLSGKVDAASMARLVAADPSSKVDAASVAWLITADLSNKVGAASAVWLIMADLSGRADAASVVLPPAPLPAANWTIPWLRLLLRLLSAPSPVAPGYKPSYPPDGSPVPTA